MNLEKCKNRCEVTSFGGPSTHQSGHLSSRNGCSLRRSKKLIKCQCLGTHVRKRNNFRIWRHSQLDVTRKLGRLWHRTMGQQLRWAFEDIWRTKQDILHVLKLQDPVADCFEDSIPWRVTDFSWQHRWIQRSFRGRALELTRFIGFGSWVPQGSPWFPLDYCLQHSFCGELSLCFLYLLYVTKSCLSILHGL